MLNLPWTNAESQIAHFNTFAHKISLSQGKQEKKPNNNNNKPKTTVILFADVKHQAILRVFASELF